MDSCRRMSDASVAGPSPTAKSNECNHDKTKCCDAPIANKGQRPAREHDGHLERSEEGIRVHGEWFFQSSSAPSHSGRLLGVALTVRGPRTGPAALSATGALAARHHGASARLSGVSAPGRENIQKSCALAYRLKPHAARLPGRLDGRLQSTLPVASTGLGPT